MEQTQQHHQEEKKPKFSEDFDYFPTKDKIKAFILWQIHHKKYGKMKKVFYEQVNQEIGEEISKSAFKDAMEFLSGAELVVNEIIVADKVPSSLLERYRICRE